jgi:hypothetical protein
MYMRRIVVVRSIGLASAGAPAAWMQDPAGEPEVVDTPGVKVLRGLTVPEFVAHRGELRLRSTP